MRKHFHKILFISIIAVLILFLFQTVTGFVTLKPLNGATTEVEKPKLTLKSYADCSFQDNVENYCRAHFGFREWLIRLYNQYIWSCFKETNNTTVVRGKGNWLFEEEHVRDHYESMMYKYTNNTAEMRTIFETEVQRLWKVQELLKEHNIHIFVVINPSKNIIYPENLPKNTTYNRPEGLRAYDYYKKRLDELGVNYIDFVPVFKKLKYSVDYPLFPETGTHWSNIASVYAFDSILRYMELLGNQNLINLEMGNKHQAETRSPDNDLELILNLASPIKSNPNLYVDVAARKDSTAIKPNFLTIGDSYYWNILNNIPLKDIFQTYPYWYYNSTIYGDDNHTTVLQVDLEKELMRHDYIMLIYNPLTLYEFSSYFLPRALLHLCYDKTSIDSMARDLVKTISLYNQPLYYEAKQVAEKTKKSLEDVLYDDALYLLRIEPEKYFKDLDGNKLPSTRNKNLKAIRNNCTFAPSKTNFTK